jgi:hypothetical protein
MKTLPKSLTTTGLLTLIAIFAALNVNAQTIERRARIGGYAEDITFVGSGALKDHLVMTNGYELHAIGATGVAGMGGIEYFEDPQAAVAVYSSWPPSEE